MRLDIELETIDDLSKLSKWIDVDTGMFKPEYKVLPPEFFAALGGFDTIIEIRKGRSWWQRTTDR